MLRLEGWPSTCLYFVTVELYQSDAFRNARISPNSFNGAVAVAKKQEVSSKKTKTAPRAATKPSKIDNAQVAGGQMTEDNKRTTSLEAPTQRGMSGELIGETAGEVWRVLS